MARRWLPTTLSSGRKPRPCSGATPSTEKKSGVMRATETRCGSAPPVRFTSPFGNVHTAAMPSNAFERVRQSSKSGYEAAPSARPWSGEVLHTMTSRSASRNGSGSSSTASMMEKIAALALIPSARVSTATAVSARRRRSERVARRSWETTSSRECIGASGLAGRRRGGPGTGSGRARAPGEEECDEERALGLAPPGEHPEREGEGEPRGVRDQGEPADRDPPRGQGDPADQEHCEPAAHEPQRVEVEPVEGRPRHPGVHGADVEEAAGVGRHLE